MGYPDLIEREQIAKYLTDKTGVAVSAHRVGRWIALGKIKLIKVPRRYGGGYHTRAAYLDALIEEYTVADPPREPWIPRVKKPVFGFPRRIHE